MAWRGKAHQSVKPRRGPLRALGKRLYYSQATRSVMQLWARAGQVRGAERVRRRPPAHLRWLVGRGPYEQVGERLAELVVAEGLDEQGALLDLGCGSGRLAAALCPYLGPAGRYEGLDVVAEAVEWCERNITAAHPGFRFNHADVRNRQYNRDGAIDAANYTLPFGDASFDMVCAFSLFTHMRPEGTLRYLCEAARVLRADGKLIATFFLLDREAERAIDAGLSSFDPAYAFRDRSGYPFWGSDRTIPEYNIALRRSDVEQMLTEAGLKLDKSPTPGRWSGRPVARPAQAQDLVVARLARAT